MEETAKVQIAYIDRPLTDEEMERLLEIGDSDKYVFDLLSFVNRITVRNGRSKETIKHAYTIRKTV